MWSDSCAYELGRRVIGTSSNLQDRFVGPSLGNFGSCFQVFAADAIQ